MKMMIPANGHYAVYCFMLLLISGCNTLDQAITRYGYNVLQPPTTLIRPGSIVEVERENPLVLGIVCTSHAAFGDSFQVPESPTNNLQLVEAVEKTFDINTDYLSQIKLDPKYTSVKRITLVLSNVAVAQLSADTVYASVPYRKPDCQRAINDYLRDNRKITMITSVLKADVSYTVEFNNKFAINENEKQIVLSGLAEKFGLTLTNSSENRIIGTGLYWGARDDARFPLLQRDRNIIQHQIQYEGVVRSNWKTADIVSPTEAVRYIPPTSSINIVKENWKTW